MKQVKGSKQLLKNKLIDVLELEYIFGIYKDANSLFEIERELSTNDYKLIAVKMLEIFKFFKL